MVFFAEWTVTLPSLRFSDRIPPRPKVKAADAEFSFRINLREQPYDPREPGQYACQLQVDNSPPLQIEPYIWAHHPSTVSLTSSQAVWASTFFAIPFSGARHVQALPRELCRGPLPCLALRSYVLDGTRTKLPTPVHILAHPASLPELSRKVTFVSRSSHRNIQKMSLEKGVTCFIWFMYLDGKNEQNISFLKMIQIRTNNTRSQSIADPRESGGAAK